MAAGPGKGGARNSIATGHSGGYTGPGLYKGVGPSNTKVVAVGHSAGYRGPGTYRVAGAGGGKANTSGQYGAPLYDPTQVLSGADLAQGAHAIADAQTQGPLAELAKQIAANNAQNKGALKLTSGYFGQLMPYAQQNVANQAGIAQNLDAQLKGIGQQTQQGVAAGFAPSAQLSAMQSQGLGGTSQQALAADQARAQAVAAQNAGTYRSAGATQGANALSLASSNLGAYASRGQESLGSIAQAGQLKNLPLTGQQAKIIASKGSLYSAALGKLRDSERQYLVTRAGLNLKQSALNATIAQNAARNQLTARGQNITLNGQQLAQMRSDRQFQLDQQKFGFTQAKNQYLLTHGLGPYRPSGGTSGLTLSQQNTQYAQIGRLQALIRDAQKPLDAKSAKALGVPAGSLLSEKQIRDLLASGRNPSRKSYDPRLIDAAYALNGWGYLSPKQVKELKSLGLTIGGHYRTGNPPVSPPGVNFFGL